ncbi:MULTISPECIES: STAS domain-containing protein [Kamptonema]|uniref:STAS domain-containing protein n=1 Tax=Kamptonema TaxID=1501433 RepID=UPI0001DAD016|nr:MULTISPECIES: STAS domain-containing protein [Kamptonema]CBN55144.1 Anti-sigma factor antagonist [Kamptonema sp. PCC 6506]
MAFQEFAQHFLLQPQTRLNFQEGNSLYQQLTAILPERYQLWVIDMTHVDFIDSSGLCALVRGLKLARNQGCRLVICNLQATARLIFDITQLDQAFEIFDSFDDISSPQAELLIA